MGARSAGREVALLLLFAMDGEVARVDEVIEGFFLHLLADTGLILDPEANAYAREVARGVAKAGESLDATVRDASTNWRLERMARVDRNLMRLAAWELIADVPRAIVIDEAVELAKRYGTLESGAFVNGVLDRVASDLKKV